MTLLLREEREGGIFSSSLVKRAKHFFFFFLCRRKMSATNGFAFLFCRPTIIVWRKRKKQTNFFYRARIRTSLPRNGGPISGDFFLFLPRKRKRSIYASPDINGRNLFPQLFEQMLLRRKKSCRRKGGGVNLGVVAKKFFFVFSVAAAFSSFGR